MQRLPTIAVSPNALPAEDRRLYKGKALEYGETAMAAAVRVAGGLPLMPYRAEVSGAESLASHAADVMATVDGLLLSGGTDVSPELYGEALGDPAWAGDIDRDRYEIALYHAAVAQQKPVFGVCRGAQVINVAEGGSLFQDVLTMRPSSLVHRDQEAYDTLGHDLEVVADGFLAPFFAGEAPAVNSIHHQGVKVLGRDLEPLAYAPDGLVEAFRRVRDDVQTWVVAVQWHPEWMPDAAPQRALFRAFVDAAREAAK